VTFDPFRQFVSPHNRHVQFVRRREPLTSADAGHRESSVTIRRGGAASRCCGIATIRRQARPE
jgi:hypothetical protein